MNRTSVRRVFLAVLLLAGSSLLPAADWPQFRGPDGNCVSSETNLSAALLTSSNLAWRVDLPGEGLSSPIIIGDRVFVTCSGDHKQETLHVLCFNAADGSKRWERRFWATGRTMCNKKTSVAAPTPASDGERIVAIFSSNDIVCLDLDGNLLWFRGLGRDYPNANNNLGMSSSLVIAGDVVVAQVESESDAFVAGLDARTGVNRWKLARPRKANWSSPVILKGLHESVALQSSKGITAVDPATGKALWEYADGTASIPSSTPHGKVLFVPSKGITALQPGSAGESPRQLWRSGQLRPGTASPVVAGGKIFALSDNGVLTCGDAATGNRQWQLRLKGEFSATPVAAGRTLFCVSETGLVQAVDISKPEGEFVSELDFAEKILSTPAIANGAIYFRSSAHLWKLGAAPQPIDTSGFNDSRHHWLHIRDTSRFLQVLPGQQEYAPSQVREIAANILLFQRANGGWPKDYDMLTILTEQQKAIVLATKERADTSFDNGNLHSQVGYLARAYAAAGEPAWREACLRGFDFLLAAQYPNGGFPQRYPKPTDFHAHITFNDYVMIGILQVLQDAAEGRPHFAWLDASRRDRAREAVRRGVECILRCQIRVNGALTGWCQQHDEKTFQAEAGRTFELASICPQDTTEILRFLLRLEQPGDEVVRAVQGAVAWLRSASLAGVRVEKVNAPAVKFERHDADFDVVVVEDKKAPPLWARHYEIGTNRPVFAGRDGVKRYALAEIERERRTGTPWYGKWPQAFLEREYPAWQARIKPH